MNNDSKIEIIINALVEVILKSITNEEMEFISKEIKLEQVSQDA